MLATSRVERASERFLGYVGKVDALSPLSILSRGYSIAEHSGRVIKSVGEVRVDDSLRLILSDGEIYAEVTDIKEK